MPATLICDSMVAALLRARHITAVVVGADRVVRNGDTANKIGTYQVTPFLRNTLFSQSFVLVQLPLLC